MAASSVPGWDVGGTRGRAIIEVMDAQLQPATAAVIERLQASLPAGVIVEDPAIVEGYGQDIVGRYEGTAIAVARPRNTAEVGQIVSACAASGLPLVPQVYTYAPLLAALVLWSLLTAPAARVDQAPDAEYEDDSAERSLAVTAA